MTPAKGKSASARQRKASGKATSTRARANKGLKGGSATGRRKRSK